MKHPIKLNTTKKSLSDIHEGALKQHSDQPAKMQQQINQIHDYYQAIIGCMPGNVYWLDKDLKNVGCNQNVLDMFGMKNQDEFYNLSFSEMAKIAQWNDGQGKAFEADSRHVIENREPVCDVEEPPIQDTNGNTLNFLSTRVPLFNSNDEVVGLVGVSTEITTLKQTQAALAASEKRRETAEAAHQAKTEFLARLSHDVRTPLSSLVALTEILLAQIDDPETQSLVQDAYLCAEQTMNLMDEILEASEFEMGQIPDKLQTFQLKELLETIYRLMKPTIEQKNLEFITHLEDQISTCFVVGYRQLLYRVILNILGNAIKFTKTGSIRLNIELESRRVDKMQVAIKITDTGMGMSEEDKQKIFDQFTRLSAAYEGNFTGRGLGLHIVKSFVDVMKGSIKVDSKLNKGTTFTVTIPLTLATDKQIQTVPEELTNNKTSSEKSFSELHILLVEDTPIAQKVACTALKALDCQVDVAPDGLTAEELAAENTYDLIFMDLGLPDISGIEATRRIREREITDNKLPVLIVALTAHASEETISHCLEVGMQQVTNKPLNKPRACKVFTDWLNVEGVDVKSNPNGQANGQTELPDRDLDPIDLELSIQIIGGSEDSAREMITEFIAALPDDWEAIKSAYDNNNMQELRDQVHRLNGVSNYVGVPHIKTSCKELESAIEKKSSKPKITKLYKNLVTAVDDVIAFSKNFQ